MRGVLGHLLAAVDAGGTAVARYVYTPFGELLWRDGAEADDFHRLFNGKELDELSGLGYYGARYYDRTTLTWTQRDPLYAFAPDLAYGEPRRMGLYTFVLNNPLRYVDPDGLDGTVTVDEDGGKWIVDDEGQTIYVDADGRGTDLTSEPYESGSYHGSQVRNAERARYNWALTDARLGLARKVYVVKPIRTRCGLI